ncbi:MAG: 3D domain-containing protein, partial [Clostridia bacterium]|nr:3D domain-containing protein [Clostridia bacterium]
TKVKKAFLTNSSAPAGYKKVVSMTATAYSAGGTTATGRPAQWGVVAVDPKVIPLGTTVYVETSDGKYIYGTAVAADTGGAIKGNKIDICVNTRSEAYSFGRRTVNVYIY